METPLDGNTGTSPASAGGRHDRATVPTGRPERYRRQLGAHLGRRLTLVEGDGVSTLSFDRGTAVLTDTPQALVIDADAPDEEALDRVRDVVARHLVRFGERDELVVTWDSGAGASDG